MSQGNEGLQRQHSELLALANEIAQHFDLDKLATDAREVRILVARFAGKLRVHERMEGAAIYPMLLSDPRPEVREKAERLQKDLGPTYALFDAFERRWASAEAISKSPREFISDAKIFFASLYRRMHLENSELYPLVRE